MRIDLQNEHRESLADVSAKVLDKVQLNLRGGNETAQTADGGNKTALDDLRHARINRFAALLYLFHFLPSCHVIGLDLRKCAAVLSAERLNVDIDHVANLDNVFCRVGLRTREFSLRNGDFLFVADVDDRLIIIDRHDGALDHFALTDIVHTLDLLLEHRAHVLSLRACAHFLYIPNTI